MSARLMIYGATGYTGNLLSERCAELGIPFVVAGRNRSKVDAAAERFGVKGVNFSLDSWEAVHQALVDVDVVIHAAGPFSKTALQMLDGCISTKTHYLDITGEFGVYALAESMSARAEAAGVMLMPGVGWDVIPSDCLGLHTSRRVEQPVHMRIALKHFGGVSRGSAISAGEIAQLGPLARRHGEIVKLHEAPAPIAVDFGDGPETCIPMPMGDLITGYKSTGIANITEYFQFELGAIQDHIDPADLPEGPSLEERDAGRSKVQIEVTGADGQVARSLIDTLSGYTYTQQSGVEVARRVLAGDFRPGWQSPSSAYGVGLATSIGDARIIDLN
ncbi:MULTISPECIES: saccharopine dehydrogenase family protein [Sphingobium]|uniref:saccharopine dehydrogenase family protein n=1 Tax=Sphingobium TaxID=165695 RepID=UPI00159C4862|nr:MULTISPECIES: saccharopine dehydrogenase NADP-binding domain-containing protein [unclassified Sphingobium]